MRELIVIERLLLVIAFLGALMTWGCAEKEGYVRPSSWMKGSGPTSSGQYRTLVLGDLDNDGNTDIVGGSTHPETIGIWYGDGKGGFTDPSFLDVRGEVHSVAAGDFNEDGLQDIAFAAHKGALGVRVRLNQGNRSWTSGISPIENNEYQGIEIADINRDGHVDIIAANSTSDTDGGIQIWLGDGKGRWIAETGPVNTQVYMDVAMADFDKDGNIDLAGAGWGAYGALNVWLGDGLGGWSPMPPLDIGSYYGVSTGDVNGDGNQDILVGSYQRGIRIFLGDDTGNFEEGTSPAEEGSFWQVLFTDLDGDFRMDLLASSIDSRGIEAWSSQGINTWNREENSAWLPIGTRFPSTGVYYEMAISDLDRDGLNDLCAASHGEGIKVWLGTGGFAAQKAAKEPVPTGQEEPIMGVTENSVFKTTDGVWEYKVGPGDVLEVSVWQGMEASKEEVLVKPDGRISFGFVHKLDVNGMTTGELEDLLTKKLMKYIKDPRIDVVVKEFHSKSFNLIGALTTHGHGDIGRGEYALEGRLTVVEALGKAGGPTEQANLREVSLRRRNGETLMLNLYKAMIQGDESQDVVLDDGDIVFLPSLEEKKSRVYVLGEVKRPGVYAFEEDMSVLEAISEAGGFTDSATLESTKIIRGDITKPEVLSADLDRLLKKGDRSQNMLLANRDVVYVPRGGIDDLSAFSKRIMPFLRLLLYPGYFSELYFGDKEVLHSTD